MDNFRIGAVTAGSNDGSISDYDINCGLLGFLMVVFVKRVDGTGSLRGFEITIRSLINSRVITIFELVQSRGNSKTLMDHLQPVLSCFNYNPPCTLDTIAANIRTLLENSGLMYADNIKDWGVMDLDSSIFYKNPNGMHWGILYHLTEITHWSPVGSLESRCVFLENDEGSNRIKCVSVEFLFDEKVLRYRFFETRPDLSPSSLSSLPYVGMSTIVESAEFSSCLQTLRDKENFRIPDGHPQWYIEGSDYMRFTGIKRIIDVYEPDNSEYTFFDSAGMPYYASYERNSVGPASVDLAFSMIEYLSNLMDNIQIEKWTYIKRFMEMRRYICELPANEYTARHSLRLFVPGNSDEKIKTISSFLLGNEVVSDLPVITSGDLKSIDSNFVNGKSRVSQLSWKFVFNSDNEWTIYIYISRIKTATENLTNDGMSEHMNDDRISQDRPPSLLTQSNVKKTQSDTMTSKMDSRNDQFTSTLRLLNRVLDTASTGL